MIVTSGFLGNASVLLPLALVCLSSFAFYQMGVRKGASAGGVGMKRMDDSTYHSLRGVDYDIATPALPGHSDDPTSLDGEVPECARDVFVELQSEDGGRDGCRGLLIRDDILVTSKECSNSNFTFHFAGYGALQAQPHRSLNAMLNAKTGMTDSRLGFLKADPPYHAHFLGRPPVRRTRMFLGDPAGDGDGTGTDVREAVVLTCGEGGRPIARRFPADDGEMVPLAELAGVLPEDILWEDKDLLTAPVLEYKSHRWWTRRIAREEEERAIKKIIKEYKGPPGSASLTRAHHSFDSQAAAVLEVVDPHGHRRDCFVDYFPRWRWQKPFSGLRFFDWLDFGPGKFLLESNETNVAYYDEGAIEPAEWYCAKKEFNGVHVKYFDDGMQREHEVDFEPSADGARIVARYRKSGELVTPSPVEPHFYMWDLDRTWYVVDDTWDEERYGLVKHSGMIAGRAALSGGRVHFGEGGALWGIGFSSGHYRPKIQATAMAYQWFKDRGFNLTAFHWVGREAWSTEDCRGTDWERIDIPGFDAAALNRSCHEVTNSPTWIRMEDDRRR